MNGAQSLIRTLVDSGVRVCFSNPGTSEMHFVAALDSVPQMRPVLGLFEGVVTGAADGFGRMSDRPACTLLHLGPGLSNGLANVHNARKARTPMVNVVGDHATYHKQYDAPLSSDVEGLARPLSHWLRSSRDAASVGKDAAEAVAAALAAPGGISTLILPADVSWNPAAGSAPPVPVRAAETVQDNAITQAAAALKSGEPCVLLMNGRVLRKRGLTAASRACSATGAKLMTDTFTARLERGAGLPVIERLPYFGEQAQEVLKGVRHLILVGSQAPVSFFAYPDKPNYLVPEGCQLLELAGAAQDGEDALERLAERLGADPDAATLQASRRPEPPTGRLYAKSVAQAIGNLLPEGAIVVDEGNTEGAVVPHLCAGAPPHTWLSNTGGSIGIGTPLAVGAAVACPDRKVVCLEGDGSAMYTIQALWTMAREQLDVTTVVFANRAYRILNIELQRVGAEGAGERALSQFDLSNPCIDFTAMARSMGVEAVRCETAEDFQREFARSMAERGPRLIEAVV